MLVGKASKDADYLYYLLLKDGSLFKKEKEAEVIKTEATVESLDEWFAKL